MRDHKDVTGLLVEDGKEHTRLIEKNLSRSKMTNEIFTVDDAS